MSNVASTDLIFCIGALYTKKFIWLDSNKEAVDLSAYEARMQIRPDKSSSTVLMELTTGNGRIELEPNSETGAIVLTVGATVTETIDWSNGVYDLEIYDPLDSDYVVRLIEGSVSVSKEVTRA